MEVELDASARCSAINVVKVAKGSGGRLRGAF